ncbi:hypothetical protein VOLCADRAFT_101037 [Volvox carteri f. nagariensis]|uniref:Uncharacterized protein n=1 Tax=Volvox carteri f. nagariensis TaxID=3068 RepID=D8ULL2_VOLCA|nr:uncharacterized protein VOLCADRAFT_101037 [Volvox carteri f. nagariensis]EFJ39388.1 hypothetical protein VOLCADRAFT_101037 [Volvox carteri f. nagariensis]|eukprot:XP_002959548.1 hypothetical protein VOLCADRAFT_101037 [Volvox carteri f. nagariensis]
MQVQPTQMTHKGVVIRSANKSTDTDLLGHDAWVARVEHNDHNTLDGCLSVIEFHSGSLRHLRLSEPRFRDTYPVKLRDIWTSSSRAIVAESSSPAHAVARTGYQSFGSLFGARPPEWRFAPGAMPPVFTAAISQSVCHVLLDKVTFKSYINSLSIGQRRKFR